MQCEHEDQGRGYDGLWEAHRCQRSAAHLIHMADEYSASGTSKFLVCEKHYRTYMEENPDYMNSFGSCLICEAEAGDSMQHEPWCAYDAWLKFITDDQPTSQHDPQGDRANAILDNTMDVLLLGFIALVLIASIWLAIG